MSKDMQKTEEKTNRRMPTFTESVIPIIAMMVILTIGKGYLGYATEPLLLLVAAIAGLIAYRVGVTWDEMMDEICQKIAKGMPAILILTCVGALVGTWMASGTIPMMIYYGVQIVNPTFMLVTAFLITAVVSIVTGTSWGSVATMGVALMGIASTSVIKSPRCPIPLTWHRLQQVLLFMSTLLTCSGLPFRQLLFPWLFTLL